MCSFYYFSTVLIASFNNASFSFAVVFSLIAASYSSFFSSSAAGAAGAVVILDTQLLVVAQDSTLALACCDLSKTVVGFFL